MTAVAAWLVPLLVLHASAPSVAVVTVRADGLLAVEATRLNAAVARSVEETGLEVLPAARLKGLLSERQGTAPALCGDDAACFAATARSLGVACLVTVAALKSGADLAVQLDAFVPQGAKPVASRAAIIPSSKALAPNQEYRLFAAALNTELRARAAVAVLKPDVPPRKDAVLNPPVDAVAEAPVLPADAPVAPTSLEPAETQGSPVEVVQHPLLRPPVLVSAGATVAAGAVAIFFLSSGLGGKAQLDGSRSTGPDGTRTSSLPYSRAEELRASSNRDLTVAAALGGVAVGLAVLTAALAASPSEESAGGGP